MASQTASNVQIAIKRQSAKGTPASGSGATGYNVFPVQGMKANKGRIENTVIRRDGQKKRARHGAKSPSVSYIFPLTQGGLDSLFEAGVRGTWNATYDITQATTIGGSAAITSITTTTNTIVGAAGSFLLQNLRAGMVIKLTGHSTAANNGKWIDVLGVTATVITLPAGSLTADAVADTSFTITVAKYLTNPQTLIERYHTIEEYRQDGGDSITMTDAKITKMEFSCSPEGLSQVTITFMGLDMVPVHGAAVFTSPTYVTTVEQVQVDGLIRLAGVDSGNILTGFSFGFDTGGTVPKVLAKTGPDVYLGLGGLSGSFTALSQDLTLLTAHLNETVQDIHMTSREPDLTDPKDFTKWYVGNLTFSDNTVQYGQTGPLPETVPWDAGIDEAGVDRALTTFMISSSAP